MVFSTGSIRDLIYSGISPFPSTISGILNGLVNNAVFFVENWTGNTLGTTDIPDRYQPSITDIATANVLKLMAVQDMGVQFVSIGDLSTNNQNLGQMAKMFEEKGMIELRSLSKGVKVYKARG